MIRGNLALRIDEDASRNPLSKNKAIKAAFERIADRRRFRLVVSDGVRVGVVENIDPVNYDDFQYDDCGHDDSVYDR